jgi:ABC-type transporter Mla subunit MlaD
MDQKSSRPEAQPYSGPGAGSSHQKPNSVGDAINRGRDAVSDATNEAVKSAGPDLQAIQNDLNSLKDTLSRFMSQASTQAVKSARDATSNFSGQVGDVASDLKQTPPLSIRSDGGAQPGDRLLKGRSSLLIRFKACAASCNQVAANTGFLVQHTNEKTVELSPMMSRDRSRAPLALRTCTVAKKIVVPATRTTTAIAPMAAPKVRLRP